MKRVLVLLLVAASSLTLWSVDFGLSETTASVALLPKTDGLSLTQSSKSTAWLSASLGNVDFRLEGTVDVSATYASSSWTLPPLRLDVGTATLHGLLPLGSLGVAEATVGRLNATDLSGWVLGSKMDGLNLGWYSGKVHAGLQGYYTGLVLKKNSQVSVGPVDSQDAGLDSVVYAPSRIVGGLSAGLNEVAARQDVSFEVLGQYDLRAADTVHSSYATLGVSGPLIAGFRHRTSATGAAVFTTSGVSWSSLAATEWTTNLSGLKVVLDAAWARGWVDASADFVPIAGKAMAWVTSLPSANAGRAGLDVSLSPAPKVSTGLKGDVLVRSNTDRGVALPSFLPTSQATLLGEEAVWYGSWSVSSELSLGWNAGAFFPSADAVAAKTDPTYLAVFTATLEL